MQAREACAEDSFELTLLKEERDFARVLLSSLRKELESSQRELASANRRCVELTEAMASGEKAQWQVDLELSETKGSLEELS